MPAKTVYKLVIGKQPYTTVDLDFGVGRVVVGVANSLGQEKVTELLGLLVLQGAAPRWGEAVVRLANLHDVARGDPALAPLVRLGEPRPGMLHEEAEQIVLAGRKR